MATGGDDNPFKPRKTDNKKLTKIDVGNQSRKLLADFITGRIIGDGHQEVESEENLIPQNTPTGPPMEHVKEVSDSLKRIASDLDKDHQLQGMISQIDPNAGADTFYKVAQGIFSDGTYNWGRVVTLFYFGYRMVKKIVEDCKHIGRPLRSILPSIRGIIEWIVDFIINNVAQWIIDRGGWESIQEYFGPTAVQMVSVALTGMILVGLYVAWKKFR